MREGEPAGRRRTGWAPAVAPGGAMQRITAPMPASRRGSGPGTPTLLCAPCFLGPCPGPLALRATPGTLNLEPVGTSHWEFGAQRSSRDPGCGPVHPQRRSSSVSKSSHLPPSVTPADTSRRPCRSGPRQSALPPVRAPSPCRAFRDQTQLPLSWSLSSQRLSPTASAPAELGRRPLGRAREPEFRPCSRYVLVSSPTHPVSSPFYKTTLKKETICAARVL